MASDAGTLAGEDAVVAAGEMLCRKLRAEPRLARFFHSPNTRDLQAQLRRFLAEAFDGEPWPALTVNEELFSGTFEPLVDLLLEALARPLPLGEDPLVSATRTIVDELLVDDRVAVFFEHVRDAAVSPETGSEGGDIDDKASAVGSVASSHSRAKFVEPPAQQSNSADIGEEPLLLEDDEQAETLGDGDLSMLAAAKEGLDSDINVQSLEELILPPVVISEAQSVWTDFLNSSTREAAGEAIYGALFESAPSLQSLFKTPRAVMAMRFMNGLFSIVSSLDNPKNLKIIVETLGFQHLDLEVTIPRVVIFRDAIVDLLETEMGPRFTSAARQGWSALMNYAGGAYIFIRMKYQDRIKILASSWATANNKKQDLPMRRSRRRAKPRRGRQARTTWRLHSWRRRCPSRRSAMPQARRAAGSGTCSAAAPRAPRLLALRTGR